jgi:hypothetical protein
MPTLGYAIVFSRSRIAMALERAVYATIVVTRQQVFLVALAVYRALGMDFATQ